MSPVPRFERLSWLRGYAVDKHQVDPRGWELVNAERQTIGIVKDLIVDTERMTGAYLDVELDRKVFHLRDDTRIFVPLARAQRDGDHKRLLVDGLTRERVTALFIARAAHEREFWDRWWELDRTGGHGADWAPRVALGASQEDLQRALEQVGSGETVRIPVVNEEIVVERRAIEDPLVTRDK
jgi:transposase